MASGRSWMPRWPYAGALAHQATRKAGGRRRGFTRLLHGNSARFADGMPEPPYRRRTPAPHHQGLVDSSGRGAGWTARDRTATARRTKRGTPQGSVISPMLANLYFRRFLLAWRNNGHQDQLDAHVVNYADDFVICCRPGHAETAKTRMEALMTRLGLEVNETKTRLACIPGDKITFLGYTLG